MFYIYCWRGGNMRRRADVICQHTRDSAIIPLKIRVEDEDGEFQTYSVKQYKRLNAGGMIILPNEVNVSSHIRYFECKINVFGKEKVVRLSYNFWEEAWYIDL